MATGDAALTSPENAVKGFVLDSAVTSPLTVTELIFAQGGTALAALPLVGSTRYADNVDAAAGGDEHINGYDVLSGRVRECSSRKSYVANPRLGAQRSF